MPSFIEPPFGEHSEPWVFADGLLLGQGEAEALRGALASATKHRGSSTDWPRLPRPSSLGPAAPWAGTGPLAELWAMADGVATDSERAPAHHLPLSMAELNITPNRVSLLPARAPWQSMGLPPEAVALLAQAAEECLGAHARQASSGRVYLHRNSPFGLEAMPPDLLLDCHLPDFEPAGGEARAWRRFQNMVQMAWSAELPHLELPSLLWPAAPLRLGSSTAPPWFEVLKHKGAAVHWLPPGCMHADEPAIDWLERWSVVATLAKPTARLVTSCDGVLLTVTLAEGPLAPSNPGVSLVQRLAGLADKLVHGAVPALIPGGAKAGTPESWIQQVDDICRGMDA